MLQSLMLSLVVSSIRGSFDDGIDGFFLHSQRRLYYLFRDYGEGDTLVYGAKFKRGAEEVIVAMKCNDSGPELYREHEYLIQLMDEPWVPQVGEFFTDVSTGLTCMALEQLEEPLNEISIESGGLSVLEVAELGLRMFDITIRLHEHYRLVNSGVHVGDWILRKKNGYVEDMVLVAMHGLVSLEQDPHGNRRIHELQRLVLNLVYLYRPRAAFYSLDRKSIEAVCPTLVECHPLLRELMEYVLSLGRFDHTTIYENIHSRLQQMQNLAMQSSAGIYVSSISNKALGRMHPDPERLRINPGWIPIRAGWKFSHPIAQGTSGIVYQYVQRAVMSSSVPLSQVAAKCRPSIMVNEESLKNEYMFLTRLMGEVWAPAGIEFLESDLVNGREFDCLLMQQYGRSLEQIIQEKLIPESSVAMIGTLMVNALETLHTKYGIAHGDVTASNWVARDGINFSNLILIDFGNSMDLAGVNTGTLRMKDLQAIAQVLSSLVDEPIHELVQVMREGIFTHEIYGRIRRALAHMQQNRGASI